jgi:microcystin-dependent protein
MREVSQYVSEPTLQVPVGMIVMYGSVTTIPRGWLLCDGTAYATTTYPALFSVLQYTYGNLSGNFLVPNFTNRIPVGAGGTATGALTGTNGAGLGITEAGLGRAIGSTGGHGSVQLTSVQSGMPGHRHTYTDNYRSTGIIVSAGGTNTGIASNSQAEVTRATYENPADASAVSSHDNLMPLLVIAFIIKAT